MDKIDVYEKAGSWLIEQGSKLCDKAWHLRQARGNAADQVMWSQLREGFERAQADHNRRGEWW